MRTPGASAQDAGAASARQAPPDAVPGCLAPVHTRVSPVDTSESQTPAWKPTGHWPPAARPLWERSTHGTSCVLVLDGGVGTVGGLLGRRREQRVRGGLCPPWGLAIRGPGPALPPRGPQPCGSFMWAQGSPVPKVRLPTSPQPRALCAWRTHSHLASRHSEAPGEVGRHPQPVHLGRWGRRLPAGCQEPGGPDRSSSHSPGGAACPTQAFAVHPGLASPLQWPWKAQTQPQYQAPYSWLAAPSTCHLFPRKSVCSLEGTS